MKNKISTIFFILLLLLVLYLAGLVIWPYISFIILAIVIAYALRPLYLLFLKWIKVPWVASTVMLILILLVIFIPTLLMMKSLVEESASAIEMFQHVNLGEVSGYFSTLLHRPVDVGLWIESGMQKLEHFLVNEGLNVLGSLADAIIGIVVMFFVLFFAFKDGDKLYAAVADALPLRSSYKHVLFDEIELVTNAVIYGQLVTAIVQGALGGIGFAIFGVPNAIFWGFIMAILSFLPVVGTPIIFVPAGVILLMQENYFNGIGLLMYSFILVMNIDNVIRPLIISEKSRLNAALILIGVLGGFKAFGFMGFILGPLVLALFFVLLKVFQQDFKPSEEVQEARKKKDELIISLHERPDDAHRHMHVKGSRVK